MIGWVYQNTHRGAWYGQELCAYPGAERYDRGSGDVGHGPNITHAFALVGALSIIRFRNAVKETRDVGFIFFTMAVGMAIGTKFYLLAVIAAVIISLVRSIMTRFNWYARKVVNQILKVQVTNDAPFDTLFDNLFVQYTHSSGLISIDTVHNGLLTELA